MLINKNLLLSNHILTGWWLSLCFWAGFLSCVTMLSVRSTLEIRLIGWNKQRGQI